MERLAPHVISATALRNHFFSLGIDIGRVPVILADESYLLPSYHWLSNTFPAVLRDYKNRIAVIYARNTNDCDDYARIAAALAQYLNFQTGAEAALAFGEFWYIRNDGQGHSINCAVVFDNDDFRLLFFEPQNERLITLSRKEIEACTFIRV